MKSKIVSSLVLASAVFAAQNAEATFNISLRTTANDASDSGAARLFDSIGNTSESTDPLWFVIDLDGDGIWNAGLPANFTYDGTIAGLISTMLDSDDFLYQSTLNNALAGRTLQTIPSIPSNAQTGGTGSGDNGGVVKPGYAIVFDENSLTDGGTFGFDQVAYGLGAAGNVIPASGNLNARIGQNTFSDTYAFSVAAVPEPTTAVFAGLGLGAVALLRRRANRA